MVNLGGSSGTTETLNAHFDSLPHASTARQMTIVVPMGNALPEGGLQRMFGAGSQSSVAVTT